MKQVKEGRVLLLLGWYWVLALVAHCFVYLRTKLYAFTRVIYDAHPPRPGDNRISAAWLQKVLRRSGSISKDTRVVKADVEGLDGNRGLVGSMTRIRIEYNNENNDNPLTLVLKMSNSKLSNRRNIITSGGVREALFYGSSKFSKALRRDVLPEIIYAYGSRWLGEYAILMGDLRAKRNFSGTATGVNLYMGNQIWGVPPEIKPRDPVKILETMYLRAAEWHAAFWRDPSLIKEDWMKASRWYQGKDRAGWELGVRTGLRCWEVGKKKAAASNGALKFSDKLVKIMDRSYEEASWEALQEHLQDKTVPWTLCHGDFHASNMFLLSPDDGGEESLVIHDWSEVGPWEPTMDLAQTLISDVKPEIFLKHAKDLVKKYWDRLIEGGVSEKEYPFSMCWEAFCRGPERWIWMFSILLIFPLPDKAFQYFHDQLLAFIEGFGEKEYYVVKPVATLFSLPP